MNVWLIAAVLVQVAQAPAAPADPAAPVVQQNQPAAPAVPGGTIAASSLFSEKNSSLYMFQDQKARRIGDILTIQVVETASASNSANTNTKRESKSGASGLLGRDAGPLVSALTGAGNLGFQGQGSTTRSGNLQAAISVRVETVLPNGDLEVSGAKEVTVNNERQMLRIRGIVRQRDVTPENVVVSTSIANMEVRFDGKGIVTDTNKPGWLYKFFSKVMPF